MVISKTKSFDVMAHCEGEWP